MYVDSGHPTHAIDGWHSGSTPGLLKNYTIHFFNWKLRALALRTDPNQCQQNRTTTLSPSDKMYLPPGHRHSKPPTLSGVSRTASSSSAHQRRRLRRRLCTLRCCCRLSPSPPPSSQSHLRARVRIFRAMLCCTAFGSVEGILNGSAESIDSRGFDHNMLSFCDFEKIQIANTNIRQLSIKYYTRFSQNPDLYHSSRSSKVRACHAISRSQFETRVRPSWYSFFEIFLLQCR